MVVLVFHITNLEWATMSEQKLHSAITAKKERPMFHKAIARLDITNTDLLDSYKSISDAAKWIINNNLSQIKEFNPNNISIVSSKLCAVANNKRNNAYNFKWKYIENIEHLENEIWKEIPYYIIGKNNYFVSNLGRYKNMKGEIKTDYIPSTGYIRIRIGESKFLLHRLVAFTFLENPENKEIVNHIDGNKLNNKLDNLEWATSLENNMHKINNGLSNCTKQIIHYDLNMNKISEFNSITDASKFLHIRVNTIISICKERIASTKCGFIFRYK
jgi:hypothetical protein